MKKGMQAQALASSVRGAIEDLDLDPPGHEALHVVDIQALVDPCDEEVAALEAAGAILAGLGPRVLRTETAGPVAVALLQARWGDLGVGTAVSSP